MHFRYVSVMTIGHREHTIPVINLYIINSSVVVILQLVWLKIYGIWKTHTFLNEDFFISKRFSFALKWNKNKDLNNKIFISLSENEHNQGAILNPVTDFWPENCFHNFWIRKYSQIFLFSDKHYRSIEPPMKWNTRFKLLSLLIWVYVPAVGQRVTTI